jgi:AcrR family transcriptional regulator
LTAAQRARRERIVQAAISLLESGEYEAIQMRDVAATAGVALATVYRYFSSKEHLYAAALLDWSKSFAERADVVLEGGSDEERLRELLRRIVRAFERWPQMLRAEVTLSAEDAVAVVDITGTVVASRLREWALGRCSIDDVNESVQRTVDMIFTFPVS